MKSCRCEQCNVSSARFGWGFALLARDGWSVVDSSDHAGSREGGWVCPACCARESSTQPGLAKSGHRSAPAPRGSKSRTKLRILLIDDEDLVRRCTVRSLADFEVVAVRSGLEALAFLERDCDFDAVLSDVMMPILSGPELYMQCVQRYPELALHFVFVSGNPEAARVQLCAAVDCVGARQAPILLSKPSSRQALVLALAAAAAHSEPRSGTWCLIPLGREVSKHRG